MIRLYDNLERRKKEFVPVTPGRVGIYVCGMTVQGPPHVGHIRAAISGDVIARWFEYRGFGVTSVQNFTDIDDKIIEKGSAEGVSYDVIAERNIAEYLDAADRMGIRPSEHLPRATEHIPEILALIGTLIEKGFAYAASGDVYYAVDSFQGYGKLSGRTLDELRAGSRIEIGEAKRNPLDFTLWKGAKPGEPSWESPWGPGRPGWHIECSAMAMKYLGERFDVHGGGIDLIFPHHENELAQSEAATGQPFVNHWAESGLVNLGGRKMSKSEGHFFLVREILSQIDPETVRFYLISTHYRSPIEFSPERLAEADRALDRFRNFFYNMSLVERSAAPLDSASVSEATIETWNDVSQLASRFEDAMDDDMNTALAVAHLFDMVKELNAYDARTKPGPEKSALLARGESEVRRLGGVLGLFKGLGRTVTIPDAVLARVRDRDDARRAKDWKRADALRDALRAEGYLLEDRTGGTSVKIVPE